MGNRKTHGITTIRFYKRARPKKEISKLPDCIKELQQFDGNPLEYISSTHNIESVLKDYEIIKAKAIYRTILHSIRQKNREAANAALISYNIFDEDWQAIKSFYYADKRNIRPLAH